MILHKSRLVEWTETLPTFESMKLEQSKETTKMNANKQTQANVRFNVFVFGFKNGDPPQANVIMDVRFEISWVEELGA